MVIVDYFVEGRCRHWENIYISLLQGVDVTCFQEEPMTNERLASMVASTSIIVIQTISSRAVKHGSETFSEDMKLKRTFALVNRLEPSPESPDRILQEIIVMFFDLQYVMFFEHI